ncbi:MAG: iron-sulfur cluster assembly protein [Hydrogenothermaceae bacterium]
MGKKEQVVEALKKVIDPEMGFNVVDLGLIYDISEDNGNVKIKMTLSSPACPLSGVILTWIENEVKKLNWVNSVDIELVWDPPWNINRASENIKKALGII